MKKWKNDGRDAGDWMVWYWHGLSLRIGLFRCAGWNWRGMCRQGVGGGLANIRQLWGHCGDTPRFSRWNACKQGVFMRNFASSERHNPLAPQFPAMNSHLKTLTLIPSESSTPCKPQEPPPHFPMRQYMIIIISAFDIVESRWQGCLFSLFSVYFSVILSKNLQNWKSAKLNHLPYRIIL